MKTLQKVRDFIKKYIPTPTLIALISLIVLSIFLAVAKAVTPLADFINSTISTVLRGALSYITYILPFSLFEMLIYLAPFVVGLVVYLMLRRGSDRVSRIRIVFSLIGVISVIYSSYILTLAVGYHATPISKSMGIEEESEISKEELHYTFIYLREKVNELEEQIEYSDGESKMPYDLGKMSVLLTEAYDRVREKYPFFSNFHSRIKPVASSFFLSDAGITGVYGFLTGEPNLNTDYPDYNLPFTSAHEFAHQRGICRENEANFMAFLVCINSTDAYIQYSGYLNMLEYLANALYTTDKQLYFSEIARLSIQALDDIKASNEVTKAHKESWIRKLSDRLNDTYLKANGTEGVVTYGYVVRLAVGYIRTIEE